MRANMHICINASKNYIFLLRDKIFLDKIFSAWFLQFISIFIIF